MLTSFSKTIMFLTSYVPLYIIFLINFLFEISEKMSKLKINKFSSLGTLDKVTFFIIASAIVVPPIILALIFALKRRTIDYINIDSVSKADEEILNYVLAYIIPFTATDILSLKDLITFLIFFLIIGFMYVKSSLIHINPTLYFVGYNIYSINGCYTLITKRNYTEIYTRNIPLKVSELSSGIYLDFNKDET